MNTGAGTPRPTAVTFAINGVRFNYRAVAVVMDRGRVLLHRAEGDSFWSVPGGRVHLLESAEDSLRREIREELGVAATIERLVWVVETFFEYDGWPYHELGFYFLTSFSDAPHLYASESFDGDEEGVRLQFRWFRLEHLESISVYPTFLVHRLRTLSDFTEYFVHSHSDLNSRQ